MYWSYFFAVLILTLSPGPDIVFVFSQSLQHGWRSGFTIILGVCIGLIVHILLALLGISTLILASKNALIIIQGLGALYLIYLAWQSFQSFWYNRNILNVVGHSKPKKLSVQKCFIRGLIINVTNVKVFLFFIAILPQFIDISRDDLQFQIVILGGLTIIATFLVFVFVSIGAGVLGSYLSHNNSIEKSINLVTAIIMLSIASFLFVDVLAF